MVNDYEITTLEQFQSVESAAGISKLASGSRPSQTQGQAFKEQDPPMENGMASERAANIKAPDVIVDVRLSDVDPRDSHRWWKYGSKPIKGKNGAKRQAPASKPETMAINDEVEARRQQAKILIKDNTYPKSYRMCKLEGCPAKRWVQQIDAGGQFVISEICFHTHAPEAVGPLEARGPPRPHKRVTSPLKRKQSQAITAFPATTNPPLTTPINAAESEDNARTHNDDSPPPPTAQHSTAQHAADADGLPSASSPSAASSAHLELHIPSTQHPGSASPTEVSPRRQPLRKVAAKRRSFAQMHEGADYEEELYTPPTQRAFTARTPLTATGSCSPRPSQPEVQDPTQALPTALASPPVPAPLFDPVCVNLVIAPAAPANILNATAVPNAVAPPAAAPARDSAGPSAAAPARPALASCPLYFLASVAEAVSASAAMELV
eukprot:jgi/Ulvmu1/8297/UM042_0002.1